MTGRLVVTGGAGFIGVPTVRAALDAGWDVHVVDSLRPDVHRSDVHRRGVARERLPGRLAALADLDAASRLSVTVADLRDPGVADAAVDGADVVVHLAAKVGLGVSLDDAPDYVDSNGTGTAHVLAAMARRGVPRLVLASSMVVYGEGRYTDPERPDAASVQPPPRRAADLDRGVFDPLTPTGRPYVPALVTEDAELDPRNVYAATKLHQEHLAAAWARTSGGTAALLRYHNVYGPGLPAGTPYAGVAALFLSALAAGTAPRVFEDGAQRRDFVHVDDVAAANLAAAAWTASPGSAEGATRAFNVGSGQVRTVGDLAGELARAAGGPSPVVTGEYRLGDVRHVTASSERLRAETGWRPRVAFVDGVADLVGGPLPAAPGSVATT
ncbi:NAD-dependent epimerase/dehydratase family protein [Luteimicrobium subarcticum]|uniref:dTDP-L-rhamnose 4-epimerase n=1 Tax=Luteimicrobium subarcticum TaxID=620910 RepID=A0A2M8W1V2_9MICO|nr:NAD-dependent epimerase/dehydratase family protein [Luteimicrobium subarcticum]PJI84889.1 dTDP-L-rhamnose 4-epimerase [Luteimicrobium subarcticum]